MKESRVADLQNEADTNDVFELRLLLRKLLRNVPDFQLIFNMPQKEGGKRG